MSSYAFRKDSLYKSRNPQNHWSTSYARSIPEPVARESKVLVRVLAAPVLTYAWEPNKLSGRKKIEIIPDLIVLATRLSASSTSHKKGEAGGKVVRTTFPPASP